MPMDLSVTAKIRWARSLQRSGEPPRCTSSCFTSSLMWLSSVTTRPLPPTSPPFRLSSGLHTHAHFRSYISQSALKNQIGILHRRERSSEQREMEGNGGGSGLVVTELSHIKELVKQLDVHLGGSPDLCKLLAQRIFAVTERSIGMIKSSHFNGPKRSAAAAGLDSPPLSATPSPVSGVSNTPFKPNKKRKTSEKGRHQIRVSSAGGGADAPADDGHSWRKYGQKDILGAQHPRAYYRCTYQKTQGCAATKQVQRADDDPALFDVIYHGEHTCVHKAAAAAMVQPAGQNPDAESLLQSLSSSLTVKTEGLTAAGTQGWSATTPFSFSSPAVNGMTPPEHHPFYTPSTPENCFMSMPTSLEPSPATSGSTHMCMTPFQAQSELHTMVSALVEATSMPAADTEEAALYTFESDWSFDDSALDVNNFDVSALDVNNFDVSAFLA